jgi:hypothetical protein
LHGSFGNYLLADAAGFIPRGNDALAFLALDLAAVTTINPRPALAGCVTSSC